MAIIQDSVPKRQAIIFMAAMDNFEDTINDTSNYLVVSQTDSLGSIVINELVVSAIECVCPPAIVVVTGPPTTPGLVLTPRGFGVIFTQPPAIEAPVNVSK